MNYTNPDDTNSMFYAELYKSLDNDSDTECDSTKCLISDEILVDKFVKLPCGHSFNYIPLYNDIKNHKTKFNHMEATAGKLLIHELRCPYCRNIHASLLPYYEDLDLAKIHGVNWLDPTPNSANSNKVCSFVGDNENPTTCSCIYGIKVNYFDKKMYCYNHTAIVNNTYLTQLKEAKQKVKDEKQKVKDEKQKVKDEKQKVKEEKQKVKDEKQKVKEEKQKVKEEKQKVKDETSQHVTSGEENIVVSGGCIATLKTGARKGHVCNKRVHTEAMCKLHYCIFVTK
jgi:hypothetical protein